MKKKNLIIISVSVVVTLLFAIALFGFCANNYMPLNGVAYAETIEDELPLKTEVETEAESEVDFFSRIAEWVKENSDEIISALGVIITLIILPLLRNIGNKSDVVNVKIAETKGIFSAAADTLYATADKLSESQNELKNSEKDLQRLNEEMQSVRAELLKNGEQLNALLQSVYTAFMGSNISDGVKGILSNYMSQAMSFDGEREIAKEKLEKTKELLSDAAVAVSEADATLKGKTPIDR